MIKIPFLNRQFQSTTFEVWFLQKTIKGYILLEKKKLKLDKKQQKTMVSYKNKTFIIPEESSLEDKRKQIIMFDFDNEKIIAFKEIKLGYSAKLIDQLIVKEMIAQIAQRLKAALNEQTKGKIGTYIVIAIGAVLAGYVIGSIYPIQTVNPATKMILGVLFKWL